MQTKSRFKRILSGITSLALSCAAFAGMSAMPTKAATANWKFDFGASGTASGFTGVSASDAYNASRGYGFSGSVADVIANGVGANADAVSFTGGEFQVDLPTGLYQVTVTTGDSPRTSIKIEGMLQMINLTGTNAVESIQVPVTDGKLNISAVAGMNGVKYTIAALEITQLNTTGAMKPTIWICGDSTVANYYNTPDYAQHGWGQYLKNYINTNVFEVRNQASSGQYAKGFVDGGQFDAIKYYGKPGDYYVISIGINDTNYSNGEEYYNVVTDMVKVAKGKGMNVILVKQQGRHGDLIRTNSAGSYVLLGGRWFGGQLDQIAQEQGVTVIDDFTAWQNFGLSLGADNQAAYDAMYEYYAGTGDNRDDLHQSAKGAQKNAEIIAGLMKIGDTEMDTSVYYTFKNTNSGLVMDVAGGEMAEGTNLQQWGSNGLTAQQFQLTPFAGGTTYYYMRSAVNPDYCLKAMSADSGGNIELVPYNTKDSMMLFQFTKIGDGSYYISTRSSRDACFVEVASASKESGANVQQWEYSYSTCQNWQAVKVEIQQQPSEPDTQPTSEPDTQPTQPSQSVSGIMGDINADGVVDIFDMAMMKRMAMRTGIFTDRQMLVADVTGDGTVDMKDAVLLQKHLMCLDAPFADMIPKDPYADYYFAVDQTWEQGYAETLNAGYTKEEGYVNLNNELNSNITFTVNVAQEANYYVEIRMANGKNDDRTMRVEVNGNTQQYWRQPFIGTDAWDNWKTVGIVLPLKAGANTIKFISETENGGPNLDYIRLDITDEPIAEIFSPEIDAELERQRQEAAAAAKPVVYIAGDSTVQSYRASAAPQQGWGYYLGDYFNEGIGSVSNHAIAGRSTKSFYDQGRFETIANSLKAGDYVLIQFAINDADYTKSERYAPVCGNVNNPEAGSYEWYMTQFINATLDKGATPILVTTVIGLKAYSNGKFVNSYTNYCDACKSLASKYNIPCIDLNTLMVNHYNSVGYDTAWSYHLMGAVEGSTDGTHFCEKGANVVAGLVAGAIKNQKIEGLYTCVK